MAYTAKKYESLLLVTSNYYCVQDQDVPMLDAGYSEFISKLVKNSTDCGNLHNNVH